MDLLIAANTVTQPNSDLAPATGTPGWATDGDPTTNTLATQAPAWHYNMMMAEMLAIVKAAGITPSNKDWSQVLKAMQTIFAPAQRGVAPYSATLAQLIGGYPKYAIVVDAAGVLWRSSADANMTVPGADGATWGSLFDGLATQAWADDRYQKSLGFTPVQQGGGAGQGTNKVALGWAKDGSGLKCQIDATDEGYISFRGDQYFVPFSGSTSNSSSAAASISFTPVRSGRVKIDFNVGQSSSNNISSININTSGLNSLGGGGNHSATNLYVSSLLYEVAANTQAVFTVEGIFAGAATATSVGGVATFIPYND